MVVIKPPTVGGEAGTEVIYNCASGIKKGDVVYISGIDTVDLADNNNLTTVPCIGMVESKPSSTTCKVKNSGEIEGLAFSITPGQKYYLGTAGGVTTTPPTASNTIVQIIGVGVKTGVMLMTLSYNFVQNK